jgi:hypothetical protein
VTVNHIIDQYIAHLSSQESNLARKSVAAEVKISSLRTFGLRNFPISHQLCATSTPKKLLVQCGVHVLSCSALLSYVIRDPEFRKLCTIELAWVITHFA